METRRPICKIYKSLNEKEGGLVGKKELRAMDRKPPWFFPLNVSLKSTHQGYKTRSTCPKCGGQRTSSLWQMLSFQTMRDLDKQTSLLDLLNPHIFIWFSSWIVRHECWYKPTYGLVESYRTDTILYEHSFPFFLSLPSLAHYPGLLAGWFLLVSLIPSSVCMLVRRKSNS